jgi:hypothetical protein
VATTVAFLSRKSRLIPFEVLILACSSGQESEKYAEDAIF